MKVLVNGLGNIGTTLVYLLLRYRDQIGIDKIYAARKNYYDWQDSDHLNLKNERVELLQAGVLPDDLDYVFEATSNGVGLDNLEKYRLAGLKACAQGSEKGFGIPFMTGLNNEIIRGKDFINIVSCNTHGTAALLSLFAGKRLENLRKADIVVVRRSEDIGNHERLVSANVVARHLNPDIGTHHAIDVVDMFKTLGVSCALTSSDITTPSQLLHAVRFNIELINPLENDINKLIANSPFIGSTQKFDSNVIFEQGRRHGFQGRIFEHAIIVSENLMLSERTIKGWAFVAQEGNSLLSTLHSFLLQTNHPQEELVVKQIASELIRKRW